jgi:type II secretory ATPase GspE/PulE/Tfp pilus assembly ATPase PilB-like protein
LIREFPAPHDPFDGSAEESPIAQLWYGVLRDCLQRGCQRIHVFRSDAPALIRPGTFEEVDELLADEEIPSSFSTFTVRAYVNDAWEDVMQPPGLMYAAFFQRLKVMASFSLAKRPPLEQGRFRFVVGSLIYQIEVTVRVLPDGSQEAMIDLPSAPMSMAGRPA